MYIFTSLEVLMIYDWGGDFLLVGHVGLVSAIISCEEERSFHFSSGLRSNGVCPCEELFRTLALGDVLCRRDSRRGTGWVSCSGPTDCA